MSGVKSLVERYNAQVAQCRQLQGGLKEDNVCLPVQQVEDYTEIYKNATRVIHKLQEQRQKLKKEQQQEKEQQTQHQKQEEKPDTLKEELRAAQAYIKDMVEAHARDKLEFGQETQLLIKARIEAQQSGEDAFTQLNEKLQAAYAQIQKMIQVQQRDKVATEKLQDMISKLITHQKEYCDYKVSHESAQEALDCQRLNNVDLQLKA